MFFQFSPLGDGGSGSRQFQAETGFWLKCAGGHPCCLSQQEPVQALLVAGRNLPPSLFWEAPCHRKGSLRSQCARPVASEL